MNCLHFNSAAKNTPEYFLLIIVRIIDGVFAPGERQIISFYSYMLPSPLLFKRKHFRVLPYANEHCATNDYQVNYAFPNKVT